MSYYKKVLDKLGPEHADQIAQWLSNNEGGSRFISHYTHSFPLGLGFKKGSKKIKDGLKTSEIILVKDRTVDIGFRILTGYPFLK